MWAQHSHVRAWEGKSDGAKEQKSQATVQVLVKIPTDEKAQKQEKGTNEPWGIESIWCQSVMV